MIEKPIKILLVEDDPNLGEVLKDFLYNEGYSVDLEKDGQYGMEKINRRKYDLCILDIMLPNVDGFEIAKSLRKHDQTTPIIFLTARTLKEDRIKGFKVGADDYLTKPFSTEELNLRIQAILKRSGQIKEESKQTIYEIGDYVFDYHNLTLKYGKEVTSLTRKEADLLALLSKNKNNLVSRETALREIWGENDYFAGRSMDVFITRLRKYLRRDRNILIKNVHGAGFRLEVHEEEEE
ncbi:MAG: response regulator transcription factor [Bacteroidota bacterium]